MAFQHWINAGESTEGGDSSGGYVCLSSKTSTEKRQVEEEK